MNTQNPNNHGMAEIIDPVPFREPLPLMFNIQDAVRLNQQKRTTFYVSVFMFQAWISELSLANAAQMAEQPDPTKRSFQSGRARFAFDKHFGKAPDHEFPILFEHLMRFSQCDDPLAVHLLQASFPLSVEHELIGDFIGPRTPRELARKPKLVLALMRSTVLRLCDWLDSALHLRLLVEWHVLPQCFDPDPKKRELAYLAVNQRHFNNGTEQAQARFLNHLADAAVEQKNSPNWATFRQLAATGDPDPRPWPTQTLDTAIIKLWPLVTRYGWSAEDLLSVLRKALQPCDFAHCSGLAPCPDAATVVSYCDSALSLRWPQNQKSKVKNQKSFPVALRLLHVPPTAGSAAFSDSFPGRL